MNLQYEVITADAMVHLDRVFTAEGSPNIAFIKYWGKRNDKLVLPYNSSISMTFAHEAMRTVTSILFTKKLKNDVFYLDGQKQNLENKDTAERFAVLDILRSAAKTEAKALVVSKNYFPTASGLASSASGIATLVFAANAALEIGLNEKEMSIIARQGSGSACRSLFGGIVVWKAGKRTDGKDSFALQVFERDYWPEIIDNIVVVSQDKKKTPSRLGMRQTVNTNPLFGVRTLSAERRLKLFKESYRRRDISGIAAHMMADSNEMHALMLSTVPSIRYLNPISYSLMDAVEELNENEGKIIAGYTFDAGPNANIVTVNKYQKKVMDMLKQFKEKGSVIYIKTSRVGDGPKLLGAEYSMINEDMLRPR